MPADKTQPVTCQGCGFTLFISLTCGTGAFVSRTDGKVLFIRRAVEPEKGKLGIPGGFVDEGETVEEGLKRECKEEVGLVISNLRFLCSHPNQYLFRGVTYPVLDFFFTAMAGDGTPAALDGVAECLWLDPRSVRDDELAFPSLRKALAAWVQRDT
jgi:ADP-ribose pyrophosphatase YjhB (NUDIX family)